MKSESIKPQFSSEYTGKVERRKKDNRIIFYCDILLCTLFIICFFGLKCYSIFDEDKQTAARIDKKLHVSKLLSPEDSLAFHVDHRNIIVEGKLVSKVKKRQIDSLLKTLPGVKRIINKATIVKPVNIDKLNIENSDITSQIPLLLEKARQGFLTGDELMLAMKKIILYFDQNVAAVTNQDQCKLLDDVLQMLAAFSEMKLIIRGFADDSYDWNYNMRLSKNRAQTAANYLISKGIPDRRLKIEYSAVRIPVQAAQNQTERWKNRRTEFELLEIQSN